MKYYNRDCLKSFIQERYPDENIEDFTENELNTISNTLGFTCYSLHKAFEELIFVHLDKEVKMVDSNETIIYENGYDTGYAKGVDDTLNHIIDKLQLNKGDIILCRYDMYKDDVTTVEQAVKYLSKICPEYQVVGIPNSLLLENCTIAELKHFIKYISDIIEKQNGQVTE